ncbi:MAG TPA: UbiA-like polyprenyltransferase [Bacteroidia bacterium]|nr:UbiA-like polyprenyltransferase [Bacteroidia bacterium]
MSSLLKHLNTYLSLVKFSHTVFALPFAIIGFSLAIHSGQAVFDMQKLILVVLCMVFARSAAMAFNRLIDRRYDARNPRTSAREIPAGVVTPLSARILVVLCCLGFVLCAYFINTLCFYLSPVALLVILGYSYTKRFTPLCHLVLGLGLALAPVGAYLALSGHFDALPVLLGVLVFFWVSGFDIIYALQDDEFDREHALKSIPVLLGRRNALLLSRFFHFAVVLMLPWIYLMGNFGWLYLLGSLCFVTLLIYQHLLVKPDDLSRVNLAFGTTNGIASVCYCCFVVADVFLLN